MVFGVVFQLLKIKARLTKRALGWNLPALDDQFIDYSSPEKTTR